MKVRAAQQTPLACGGDCALLCVCDYGAVAREAQHFQDICVPHAIQARVDIVFDLCGVEGVEFQASFFARGEGPRLAVLEVVALFVGADVAAEGSAGGCVGVGGVEEEGFVFDLVGEDGCGVGRGVGAREDGVRWVGDWGC